MMILSGFMKKVFMVIPTIRQGGGAARVFLNLLNSLSRDHYELFLVVNIIEDYNMPELSGLETIAEIRKLNLDIPIILSSGSMWSEDRMELEKYQISGQLQKPYEFESMLAIINKFI